RRRHRPGPSPLHREPAESGARRPQNRSLLAEMPPRLPRSQHTSWIRARFSPSGGETRKNLKPKLEIHADGVETSKLQLLPGNAALLIIPVREASSWRDPTLIS
ncbi:hypothetical protein Nmel_005776, partial [Mimus melanotis]